MYFRYFVMISPWKKVGLFVWTKLESPYYDNTRIICAMFGWNCTSTKAYWAHFRREKKYIFRELTRNFRENNIFFSTKMSPIGFRTPVILEMMKIKKKPLQTDSFSLFHITIAAVVWTLVCKNRSISYGCRKILCTKSVAVSSQTNFSTCPLLPNNSTIFWTAREPLDSLKADPRRFLMLTPRVNLSIKC